MSDWLEKLAELKERIEKAKDALGHGSYSRGGVTLQYKRVLAQPKTPGIHVEATRVASYRYPQVVHTASGKIVANFGGAPLQGTFKDFAAAVDKHLGGLSWDRPEAELMKDPKPLAAAVSNLRTEVNERNHYRGAG